ncbi:MAG: hypothetical protein JW717_13755 [Marinilabiliaceae bacterium]|nr:hypothetical protein [Marinilabiliaceae bacterium]
MTTIISSISKLLCLHDCVIIPGFGGFVTNYEPASIDEEKGFFQPPSKSVGFNKNLIHNDGLLYHHLVQNYSLSYEEAKQRVESFVEELHIELTKNKSIQLGEIGILSLENNSIYVFVPNKNSLFLADSFGLASFHAIIPDNVKSIKRDETPIRHIIKPGLIRKGVAASLFFALLLSAMELKNPENVAMGSFANFNVENATQSLPIIEKNIKNSELNEEVIEESDTTFHIVIASFPKLEQAIQFVKKWNKANDENCIVISKDGKNRVSYMQLFDRQTAMDKLKKIRKKKGLESSWMLKEMN